MCIITLSLHVRVTKEDATDITVLEYGCILVVVRAGVSLVKLPNVYCVVLTLDLLLRHCLVHILYSWRINIYIENCMVNYYCTVALLVNVALVALCSVCVL